MAPRILALDGTKEDVTLQMPEIEGIGIISDAYFHDIADAIRAQNGRTETYKPAEMAPAILALTWDTGVKIRALLLSDGTLEFNYRDGRSSDVEGATILRRGRSIRPATPRWGSPLGRRQGPRDARRDRDADMEGSGLASAAYLFHGCENLVEVEGFGHLTTRPT